MRRLSALACLLLAVLAVGCGGGGKERAADVSGDRALTAATRLVDLAHPDQRPALFALFNASAGIPRLVLLLSPT